MARSTTAVKAKSNSLDNFTLAFEYDRSWGDARKALRQKTNHA